MSKNLVVFLLLMGGVFYLAHKKMKEKTGSLTPQAVASQNSQQNGAQESPQTEAEPKESSDEEAPSEPEVVRNYKDGYFVCPKELSLTPYGLSSNPNSGGFYFKKIKPMVLISQDYGSKQITCTYNSNLGGVYYLYQALEGTQCLPMNEGYGFQCNQGGDVKSYRCWEIRTSANERPYLRFRLEGTKGENISKVNGWEYEIPKGFASSVEQTRRKEMECAYSISVSGQFTLVNKVMRFKSCSRKGEGVECY